jgi:hypothetical protein
MAWIMMACLGFLGLFVHVRHNSSHGGEIWIIQSEGCASMTVGEWYDGNSLSRRYYHVCLVVLAVNI